MENASEALIIACGILIGMLLLTFLVTVFISAGNLSESYDDIKKEEQIQQFNANFTQYLNQSLTIHQVVTICNFAKKNGVQVVDIYGSTVIKNESSINSDVSSYNNSNTSITTYTLTIMEYSEDGYITKIQINRK